MHRHPATIGHRPLRHRDDAAVFQFLRESRRLQLRVRRRCSDCLLRTGERAVSDRFPVVVDGFQHGARLGQLGRQAVHLHIGLVANNELVLDVEHAQAMGHVIERDVDTSIELLQLDLTRNQLNGMPLNTSTARAISPTSSASSREGILTAVSFLASCTITCVTRRSLDSTLCIVVRPIGPIRIPAINTIAARTTSTCSTFREPRRWPDAHHSYAVCEALLPVLESHRPYGCRWQRVPQPCLGRIRRQMPQPGPTL